ncbi:hypothetical protein U1Q18_018696 [Sarracenia purpurea var. burkii]
MRMKYGETDLEPCHQECADAISLDPSESEMRKFVLFELIVREELNRQTRKPRNITEAKQTSKATSHKPAKARPTKTLTQKMEATKSKGIAKAIQKQGLCKAKPADQQSRSTTNQQNSRPKPWKANVRP